MIFLNFSLFRKIYSAGIQCYYKYLFFCIISLIQTLLDHKQFFLYRQLVCPVGLLFKIYLKKYKEEWIKTLVFCLNSTFIFYTQLIITCFSSSFYFCYCCLFICVSSIQVIQLIIEGRINFKRDTSYKCISLYKYGYYPSS